MKKLLFTFYKIVFILFMVLAIFIPVIISSYLEDIEYTPYKINKENENLKAINLKGNFIVEPQADFPLLNDKLFDKEVNYKPNLCILDEFVLKEDINGKESLYSHGEYVMNMIAKRHEGNIIILPVNHFSFSKTPIEEWNNCDVINYSMGIEANDINNFAEKQFINFLKNYKGILIVAAGNEGDSKYHSQFSYLKSKYPDLNTDNLFIVTQGESTDNNMTIKTSKGSVVDIVVFNYGEKIYGKKQYGSSFAAPVVTSVVANLLSSGHSKTEVINKLNTLNDVTIDGIRYKNLDISQMYQ